MKKSFKLVTKNDKLVKTSQTCGKKDKKSQNQEKSHIKLQTNHKK